MQCADIHLLDSSNKELAKISQGSDFGEISCSILVWDLKWNAEFLLLLMWGTNRNVKEIW